MRIQRKRFIATGKHSIRGAHNIPCRQVQDSDTPQNYSPSKTFYKRYPNWDDDLKLKLGLTALVK